VKEVFESLEKGNDVTLMLVVPSYYLLLQKLAPGIRESSTAQVFKEKLRHYLDASSGHQSKPCIGWLHLSIPASNI